MRKIWAFFWYQNLRKFEKNLKQSDRAPLKWNVNNNLYRIHPSSVIWIILHGSQNAPVLLICEFCLKFFTDASFIDLNWTLIFSVMEERYVAAMVLSGVGDAMGYKAGGWEFNFVGEDIHKELQKMGGIKKLNLKCKYNYSKIDEASTQVLLYILKKFTIHRICKSYN